MTLTQTAVLTKRVIVISIVVGILGISSFIGYRIWHAYYIAHLPPVEEKPDAKFGQLPLPDFPKGNISSSNFSYSLDTTTGGLPKVGQDPGFGKIVKVYFIAQPFATLLAPERSQSLAQKFNIATAPAILSETKYQFDDKGKSLIVNLDSGNFSYTNESTMSAKLTLDVDNKLVTDFEQMLSTLGILNDDLKNGTNKVIPLRNDNGQLTPTNLRSEAQAAQISLWPSSIDQKSIFTPNPNKSLVNAVVFGGADKLENYQTLNFSYYPIDINTYATYPIKTAESAFDDLKNGKGAVIVVPKNPQVSITSVELGYYLSESYTPYLQPIFVFEGPNFISFVSAISEQYQGH